VSELRVTTVWSAICAPGGRTDEGIPFGIFAVLSSQFMKGAGTSTAKIIVRSPLSPTPSPISMLFADQLLPTATACVSRLYFAVGSHATWSKIYSSYPAGIVPVPRNSLQYGIGSAIGASLMSVVNADPV
jgi:hypothetical protein